MNVLFLTLVEFETLQEHNIYTDLLREFVKNGHYVCAISPVEKRKQQTENAENQKQTIEQVKQGSEIIKNIAGSDAYGSELLARLGIT